MRRQVLFVGLICGAFLVNAQEEKTIDLDEVTIQASSIIRKKDRQLIFPSKDQMQRSMDGLDLTRRMSLPRLWVDPNTKSISMANGNVQLRINGVLASSLEVAALSPEDIKRVEYHDNPGLRYGEGIDIVLDYITIKRTIISQTHNDCRFGDLAVREGYLTQEQVDELVKTQYPDFLLLGQTLVEEGYINNAQLETLITDYESENEITDLDYSNEKQDDLDRILANFFHTTDVAADEYNASYMRLLFNDLTRFIGDDFTPLCFNPCKEYPVNYCVSQTIHGDLSAKVYLDMPETTCISFASRYVNEEFTEFDEYVQASLEDFLNLHK